MSKSKTQKVKPESTLVCKIYANWCVHCKDLKPVWKELETIMDAHKNIKMIEVEESEMEKLKDIYKKDVVVKGFPTIVKICKNKGEETIEYYGGPRTVDALRKWILPRTTGGKKKHKHTQTTRNKKNIRTKRTTRK
jgi:thiol-disulfide isomerase/thioredoxin